MAAPPPSQTSENANLVVRAAGQPLPDSWRVISVDVWSGLGQPSRARLILQDGDIETATFPVSDSNGLAPGVTLEIALGHEKAGASSVFSGTILRQGIEIAKAAQLIVEAEGPVASSGGPVALTLTWGEDMRSFRALGKDRETMTGEVAYQGSTLAKAGDRITLVGVSARFSGDVVVRRLHHSLHDGLWQTVVTFGHAAG